MASAWADPQPSPHHGVDTHPFLRTTKAVLELGDASCGDSTGTCACGSVGCGVSRDEHPGLLGEFPDTVGEECCLGEVGGWALGAACPGLGPPRWALQPGCRQALLCAHLEAVVSSCRAGLRLRSGPLPTLWRPPRAPQTPPRSREGRPRRLWAGEGGRRGLSLSSEEPFGFPLQIRKSSGETVFTPVTPTSKSGRPETHIWFCF